MIVTRGLGRAAVVGALVVFGLGADPTSAQPSTFSGGQARIGVSPAIDQLERIGALVADAAARVGEPLATGPDGRVGAAELDQVARVGAEALETAGERVGEAALTQRARIGAGVLRKRT